MMSVLAKLEGGRPQHRRKSAALTVTSATVGVPGRSGPQESAPARQTAVRRIRSGPKSGAKKCTQGPQLRYSEAVRAAPVEALGGPSVVGTLKCERGGKPPTDVPGKPGFRGEEGPTKPKSDQSLSRLQVLIKQQWQGYRVYHNVAFSLTENGAGIWKERHLPAFMAKRPSCFWIALFLCHRFSEHTAFERLISTEGLDLSAPVSVAQAIELLRPSEMSVPVHWHDIMIGVVEDLRAGRPKAFSPGVMHVLTNDEEALAPHWLPVARPKPESKYTPSRRCVDRILAGVQQKVPLRTEKEDLPQPAVQDSNPYAVLEDEVESGSPDHEPVERAASTEIGDPPAEAHDVVDDMPNAQAEEETTTIPVVERVAQAIVEVPGPLRIGTEDIPFFNAAYGWTPPPCPTVAFRGRGLIQVRTRWFCGQSDESSLHAVAEPEGFFTRNWLARVFGRVLVETRKDVLIGRRLAPGDWLYTRIDSGHGVNDRLSATGAICMDQIETLECEGLVLCKGPVMEWADGDRKYQMAELKYHASVGACCSDITVAFGLTRRPVRRIGLKTQTLPALTIESLASLPNLDSRIRAAYTLMKPLIPEEVRGPLNDIRNVHLSIDTPENVDPVRVAQEVCELDKAIRTRLQHIPAYGHKRARAPKSCISCGVLPPPKYRWKHRLCGECRAALDRRGYTTWSGYQVQENMHVPSCYPGLVYIRPEEYPPTAKKWKLVDIEPTKQTEVEIDLTTAVVRQRRENAPKRFTKVGGEHGPTKDDILEQLKKPFDAKPSHCLAGIGCSGARPMVSAKTSYNSAKALMGRVYLSLPERPWGVGPMPGLWEKMKEFVPELLPDFRAPRMEFDTWLETMPRERRPALRKAMARLERAGWLRSMACFSSFVKLEMLPGFSKKDGDLRPLDAMLDRLINGPADETHCIAGPVLKPLVHRLKEVWNEEAPVFYGSAGPEKLHKFLQTLVKEESQYFWCDFSMFDRTHSRDSWAFMESLYQENDPLFRKVLDVWRQPRGRIGPMRFKAPVINASGRDDTALANGILNGFATYCSACAAWLNVEVEALTVRQLRSCMNIIKLSVCGDDSLGKIPYCSEERMVDFRLHFNKQIEKFGFVAKLQTSPNILQAVYLGMRPYPTEKGWFWGKTIGRASYKMGWVMLKDGRDPMAHLTGIADMHTLCSAHVPVLSDLAKKIVELREGARRTPVYMDPNRPWEWTYQAGVEYSEVTLAAVAEVYSSRNTGGCPVDWEREVTVDDVKSLIREIQGVNRLPAIIDHWLWKHMVFADDL